MCKGKCFAGSCKSILYVLIIVLLTVTLLGCGTDSDGDNKENTRSKKATATPTEEQAISPTPTEEPELPTEPVEPTKPAEITEPAEPTPRANDTVQITEIPFFKGSEVKIRIICKHKNEQVFVDENGEERFANIDIIDTGSEFLLNVSRIEYDLRISNDALNAFLKNAIKDGGNYEETQYGDKLCIYDIVEGSDVLTCMGENFRLTYCKDLSQGRGYACEFEGEDGAEYSLSTNLIPDFYDDLTDCYLNAFVKDGATVQRVISYEEDTYIRVSYEAAKETEIGDCVTGERYYTNAAPTGDYYVQTDAEGNIIKVKDLWFGVQPW